jgi:outer membrane protein assembly factor BamA
LKFAPAIGLVHQARIGHTKVTTKISTDVEYNKYVGFDTLTDIIQEAPALGPLLRVPTGQSGIYSAKIEVEFDGRDKPLNPSNGYYLRLGTEYVQYFFRAADDGKPLPPRYQFAHLSGQAATYVRLPLVGVLAFDVQAGINRSIGACFDHTNASTDSAPCDSYPDRLFRVGGADTDRGYYQDAMIAQDTITQLLANAAARAGSVGGGQFPHGPDGNPSSISALGAFRTPGYWPLSQTPTGGNAVFIVRAEYRTPPLPIDYHPGLAIFVDAANLWNDWHNYQPWSLRYSAGVGLTLDFDVVVLVVDFALNFSHNDAFSEAGWPMPTFTFALNRF